jgi:hypothetical protein
LAGSAPIQLLPEGDRSNRRAEAARATSEPVGTGVDILGGESPDSVTRVLTYANAVPRGYSSHL